MKKNYRITKIGEITVIRMAEMPSREELVSALLEVKFLDASGLRMWILEKGVNLSADDLKAVATVAAENLKRPGRMAVVAPTDLSYGLSRMFEVFREQEDVRTHSARTEEEAVRWLNSEL